MSTPSGDVLEKEYFSHEVTASEGLGSQPLGLRSPAFGGDPEPLNNVLALRNGAEAARDRPDSVVVGYFRVVSTAVVDESDQEVATSCIT